MRVGVPSSLDVSESFRYHGLMPMTRTDIHSPTNFDPAEYRYVGAFDAEAGDPGARFGQRAMFTVFAGTRSEMVVDAFSPVGAEKRACKMLLSEAGFPGGNWETRGTCDHCGARIRYVCVWAHEPTGEHIATGETCAAERFELPDRLSFDVKQLKAAAKAAREAAEKEEAARAFLANCPPLAKILLMTDSDFADSYPSGAPEMAPHATPARVHPVISDIRSKLYTWGNLSERQVAHVERVYGWVERDAVRAQEAPEVKIPAPTGRTQFEGVVVAIKWQETDFGTVKKLVVKVHTAAGSWVCWVSEPSSIQAEKGDVVRMTANLTRSDRDEAFAFGKRPTKAQIVGHGPVENSDLPDSLS